MIRKTLLFISVISTIVLFHELGHLLVAKMVGLKPEVFSIGFGPSLFEIKSWDLVWKFSLIPLGGYVSLGNITVQEYPHEFFLVSSFGPLSNFILSFFIFFYVFKKFKKHFNYIKEFEDGTVKFYLDSKFFIDTVFEEKKEILNELILPEGFKSDLKGMFKIAFDSKFKKIMKQISVKDQHNIKLGSFVGPITMARMLDFYSRQSKSAFLLFIANISMALGIFNCLPLFGLDGDKILESSLLMFFEPDLTKIIKMFILFVVIFSLLGGFRAKKQ